MYCDPSCLLIGWFVGWFVRQHSAISCTGWQAAGGRVHGGQAVNITAPLQAPGGVCAVPAIFITR